MGRVEAEHREALDVVDLDRGADRVDVTGDDADLHVELARLADEVGERVLLDRRLHHDHAVDAVRLADRLQSGHAAEVGELVTKAVRRVPGGAQGLLSDRLFATVHLAGNLSGSPQDKPT